ncbi:bZIP transcription factor [Emericellopsis atlantica]|uniref:BZIP transcription factor n=1 Tax=Emericellopsis atlantica TaxID=2614577 RepID=A0A9P8CL04_9HYPO|nr:bZIP transcription factor [Emericellopsis atlantica]KAG9250485.1 bZIP transcription factor [Emericellopsis atlantica]
MGTTAIDTSTRGESKTPPQANKPPQQPDASTDAKTDSSNRTDGPANAEAAKPLAPPPRPGQQQNQQASNNADYFSQQPGGGSLSLEPNPFEQSFSGGGSSGQPETPGGTKLPSVHTLASPSSLLPPGNTTPFNWGPGSSLRTGPLSPAMLSGPAQDYFGDAHHLRGGFPTPNESSLRSGLTPGGSGSMFPTNSPGSQSFIASISGGVTPSTIDFHRTAMSAAAKREQNNNNNNKQTQQQPAQQAQQGQQTSQPATTQPQEMSNGDTHIKAEPKTFDPHDNDAANGLFMLAHGGNGSQGTNQFAATSAPSVHAHTATVQGPAMNGGPGRGMSEHSMGSDESEQTKPSTRGKGKKNNQATNGRRKAEEPLPKAPANKKAKGNSGNSVNGMSVEPSDDEDDMKDDGHGGKTKMTDEEKRKNFLERNRVAALKCRQRKKQWLANLQSKVEMFSNENEALSGQITQLREEVVNLKTLLLAHKDCPVTQQQGMHGAFMNQVGQVPQPDPFNQQMNPYQMAGPMANQQVMAGQGVQRRFS